MLGKKRVIEIIALHIEGQSRRGDWKSCQPFKI